MLGNPIFSRYENLDRWFCFIETINVSGVKSSSNVSELYQGSRLLVLNRIMKAEFFFYYCHDSGGILQYISKYKI